MKLFIAAALLLLGAAPPPDRAVTAAELSADVRVLASDAFGGRAPGTPGEVRTVDWLVARVRALGLEPAGPGGQWTQAVPMVRTQLGAGSVRVGVEALAVGTDVYLSTVRPADRVRIADAPVVFVGHGVSAPERDWDDFKLADLRGKVALFLVNDPDFASAPDDDAHGRFGGRRMTYYGRWTYKFEEAARRGAIGALIVHDTEGAGYGWSTVTAPAGENYDVVRAPGDTRVALQGWLSADAARRMLATAGLDLDALAKGARSRGFKPVELPGARLTADFAVDHRRLESRNVLARLPGRTRPAETVMLGAHWDAYGAGKPDAEGRTIRPGANDDALGVAGVLALARRFAKGPRPDRSLVFALWTGEERGLLGSETYAAGASHDRTVANLTLDILQTAGPARDLILVGTDADGRGQNGLDAMLREAAVRTGRTVTPEALPERGLFYRADHFPLARHGVPTLLLMAISGAPDLVRGGRAAGQAWLDGYMRCYHQTCDRWDAGWDLTGAAADVDLVGDVAERLARGSEWPEWNAGSEFKAVRDRSAGMRR